MNTLSDPSPYHRSARIEVIKTLLLKGAQPTKQAFHGAYLSKDEVIISMLLVNDTPLPFLVSSENLLHTRTVNQRRTRRPNYNPDLPTYVMSFCDNAASLPRNAAHVPHFPRISVSAMPSAAIPGWSPCISW